MILEANNLTKIYKKNLKRIEALQGVSFAVKPGSVVGILGPNGAGKSTLLKIVTGISRMDSGSLKLFGENAITGLRNRIGFLPENPHFFKNITPRELLALSLSLNHLPVDARTISDTLAKVKLSDHGDERVRLFSKGMIQRLGIAQAVIHRPELLILDEPMSGLDPLGRRMVSDLILDYKRSARTVLFSTHNLDDIELLCDEVLLIKSGKILLDKEIAELRAACSYRIVSVEKGIRETGFYENRDLFWEAMEKLRRDNRQIISIKSDLSKELEKYYEA